MRNVAAILSDEVWRVRLSANAPDHARLQPSPEAGCSLCNAKLVQYDDARPHHCLLPAGHEGRHFCHLCGLYWDIPNAPVRRGTPSPQVACSASEFTYASKQATACAVCGERKHTPLRNDAMGGYVCLTCIDRELVRLQSQNSPICVNASAAPAKEVSP